MSAVKKNQPAKTIKKAAAKTKGKPLLPFGAGATDFPVIGIGGSAGSLQALEQFFKNTPHNIGMAFIIVIHLDPTKKGMMPELLQRYTKLQVVEATDGEKIEKNIVYIIPPAKDISILNGRLLLLEPSRPRGFRMPIDFFFQSLALDQREKAAAVILSGMGADGELGLKVVKEYLGLGIVQEPGSTEFSSMPNAAISTGFADYVLLPEEIPERLMNYFYHPVIKNEDVEDIIDLKTQNALLKIFMLLRTQTGHDFSMYKRSTIIRRIERRIAVHQLNGISEYVNYLRENSHEIDVLFKDLLIGVTKFFRDTEAFEALANPLMELLKKKKAGDPVRVWVAGCSTGEEAYSIAILLIECLEKLNILNPYKIQIFATDLDSAAVEKARTGIYLENTSGDVNEKRLERFFIHQNNHYIVKKEVREMVVFAQHNIIKDSPFTKLDLLCCRNVLIYLNNDLQKKLIPLFHYSLNNEGILFLGNSETVGSFNDLFTPVNNKLRIFNRKDAVSFSKIEYPFSLARHENISIGPNYNDVMKINKNNLPEIFQKVLLEKYTPPSLIMNEKGDVLYVNGNLSKFVEISTGEPQMNIHKITKSGIRYELSNLVSKSCHTKTTLIRDGLILKISGENHIVKITCSYLKDPVPLEGLVLVVFEDLGIKQTVKQLKKGKGAGTKEHEIILELEKDLAYTRDQLENTVQQMETSFEELKSANEELQSTNEELQSTNEESITSKEEMQSLNEELMTINMQYQLKSEELTLANNDMKNLLDSMEIATVFLSNDLTIKRYTPKAAEIIKLIPSDIGRPISHLSSSLVYKNLEKDMKDVIMRLTQKEISVSTVSGKSYSLRITPYRTHNNFIEGIVLAFIDISKLKELENKLSESLDYSEGVVNSIKDSLVVIDKDFRVISINQSFKKTFKFSIEQIKGYNLFKLVGWQLPEIKKKVELLFKKKLEFDDVVIEKFVGITNKSLSISGKRIPTKKKEKMMVLITIKLIHLKKNAPAKKK